MHIMLYLIYADKCCWIILVRALYATDVLTLAGGNDKRLLLLGLLKELRMEERFE